MVPRLVLENGFQPKCYLREHSVRAEHWHWGREKALDNKWGEREKERGGGERQRQRKTETEREREKERERERGREEGKLSREAVPV